MSGTPRRRPVPQDRRRPPPLIPLAVVRPMTTEVDLTDTAEANSNLLTARQLRVNHTLASAARHICVVGGSRSGKTTLIVRAIVLRALKVRSRHAILRFRSNAVWPSIGMDTLPKVLRTFFPSVRFIENKSLHYFEFENGSQIWLGGLDDKERTEKILGNEYSTVYFNECSQIPYASVLLGLSRLAEQVGLTQRAYYDLNPSSTAHWSNILFGDKKDPVSKRPLDQPELYVREFMNPADNRSNLSAEYLASLDQMPERYRKRFRDGTYVDESDDALWKLTTLERCRRYSDDVPNLVRIVVAVDPSGAKSSFDVTHDEIGIMVVGIGDDNEVYVLADRTMLAGPDEWARMAVFMFHTYKADAIVAEINYGGAMVELTIRTADPSVPVKVVTASRGKVVRAEPVAALYEQNRVHHVEKRTPDSLLGMEREGFAKLEDELCSFTTLGYIGARSPNRADALVWAVSELALAENAAGFVEYYRRLSSGISAVASPAVTSIGEALRAGTPANPAPVAPVIEVLITEPHRAFYLSGADGRSQQIVADVDGFIRTSDPVHIRSLMNSGCQKYEGA